MVLSGTVNLPQILIFLFTFLNHFPDPDKQVGPWCNILAYRDPTPKNYLTRPLSNSTCQHQSSHAAGDQVPHTISILGGQVSERHHN